jgi:hypothetical protein
LGSSWWFIGGGERLSLCGFLMMRLWPIGLFGLAFLVFFLDLFRFV